MKAPRKHDTFLGGFCPKKKPKVLFFYFVICIVIFDYFSKILKSFLFVYKNEIFNIILHYSSPGQNCHTYVTGRNHSKHFFLCLKVILLLFYTLIYYLGVFPLFWSPWPLRISNYQPASLL